MPFDHPDNPTRIVRRLVATGALAAVVLAGCDPAPQDGASERPQDDADPAEPDGMPGAGEPEPEAEEPEPEPGEPEPGEPAPVEPAPVEPAPEEPAPDDPAPDDPGVPEAHGVSAGHPEAVEAGMEALDEGGTAVDAAISAAYAVSVVEPFASGVGGGGAALVHEQGEDPEAFDYREVVPESGMPASEIGVPGFVAGMEALRADYGSLDNGTLIAPAIELAEEGVAATGILADQLRSAADRLPVDALGHLFPGGTALAPDAPLVQEELAATLRTIAGEGAEAFYEGALAEALAGRVAGLDAASLAVYEVGRHEPVVGHVAGYDVVGAAPPLPGATVVQMLQMAEALGVADQERGSADFIHTMAMSWRLARQFLETDLGDPGFVDVPTGDLTDPDRNADLAEEITGGEVLPVDPGQPYGGVDPNTTHITVVDSQGTVVSMTNTLTNFWGSGEYELGFFLNNQMARFELGRTEANEPEPGRRSVTWSSPMVVADEDGPVLGLGTPGGERIPMVLAQVLTGWAAHGEGLDTAVSAPRVHGEDTALIVEEPLPEEVSGDLLARGYSDLRGQPTALYFGSVQTLEIDRDGGELVGATDERRDGDWRVEESAER